MILTSTAVVPIILKMFRLGMTYLADAVIDPIPVSKGICPGLIKKFNLYSCTAHLNLILDQLAIEHTEISRRANIEIDITYIPFNSNG